VCLLLALTVGAYEAPLSPASLHDAWTLGQRNDQATANVLSAYIKEITEKVGGEPRIAEIEILTPFAQVVDESRQNPSNFSEEQAIESYHKRGDTIVVSVQLMLPAVYPKQEDSHAPAPSTSQKNAPLRPENFWQSFHFNFKQHEKVIPIRTTRSKPIYSAPTKDAPSVLDGATVWLRYDPKDVASEQAVVEVITPGSRTIIATFDLNKLR
jgi:hypothetical protein